jgi:hypothetical protein
MYTCIVIHILTQTFLVSTTIHTFIVNFYYTSKPECAIPDDNHIHTHIHMQPCQKFTAEPFHKKPTSVFFKRFGVLFEEFTEGSW